MTLRSLRRKRQRREASPQAASERPQPRAFFSFSFSFSFVFSFFDVRALLVGVVVLVVVPLLTACPQRPAEGPQPPIEIFVEPGPGDEPKSGEPKSGETSGETSDESDAGEPAAEGPTFKDPDSLRAPERSDSTNPAEDFRNTLEGMPKEPPKGEGEGVREAGGCEGGTRAVGETWKQKCNTCICEKSGEVACTLMACAGSY